MTEKEFSQLFMKEFYDGYYPMIAEWSIGVL
jgi:hypothetical protein